MAEQGSLTINMIKLIVPMLIAEFESLAYYKNLFDVASVHSTEAKDKLVEAIANILLAHGIEGLIRARDQSVEHEGQVDSLASELGWKF